jgi:hypothetical protein
MADLPFASSVSPEAGVLEVWEGVEGVEREAVPGEDEFVE